MSLYRVTLPFSGYVRGEYVVEINAVNAEDALEHFNINSYSFRSDDYRVVVRDDTTVDETEIKVVEV